MPTYHNETLLDRYQREHEADLARYARLTPEEVFQIDLARHNAEAKLDALERKQTSSWRTHDSHSGMRFPEASDLTGGATDCNPGPTHYVIADFLQSIGWKPAGDAQWENLRKALPELQSLLNARSK
jgi:hypothetical protein